jgi:RHS repeat-associated protein
MLPGKTPAPDRQQTTSTHTDAQSDTGNPVASPPALALPKGGGAIRGIGEKFAANPVTGTGSMSVPIATSPGRSGFGPQLSLAYDSGAGNGVFGFGWSLALPAITRKTDKGLPQYFDAQDSDVFILSGAEDLVPEFEKDTAGNLVLADGKPVVYNKPRTLVVDSVAHTYTVRRYRPRIEGLFARIERWTRDDGDVHWRSISKDNILTLYGKDENSRICAPDDHSHIFTWLICETRDDKGNAVLYQYKPEDGDGVDLTCVHERNRGDRNDLRRATNRYLKRIRYGNRVPLLDTTDGRPPFLTSLQIQDAGWMFEVVFDYGDHDTDAPMPRDDQAKDVTHALTYPWKLRQDSFSMYRAGFEVRTSRLCQRVLMFHHFEGEAGVENDCLVRSTDFAYSHQQDPNNARNSVYTFLREVTHSGYKRDGDIYLKRSLPPVAFEYSQPIVQDTVQEVDAASHENLPIGVDGAAYQCTDLHGEGLPGILSEQAGGWFYKRNISPISTHPVAFAPLERVAVKPNLALAAGAQFMDLAGDGEPDLVVFDGPMPGFYEHDADEGWQSFRPFSARLNRDMRDPNLKFVDLDGDGHADVLISEDDALVWHASLAEQGFGPARHMYRALDEEHGPRLVFADGTQSIYLADLSGDGLTDLARIRNGEICYWPNLGYGRFGAKVTMDHAPYFDHPDQFDHKRIRLADIDGSGTTDIIYLHRAGVRLYFNQSGNGWSAPRVLNVFPRVDDLVSIVPTDLLGNGTACLVWSSPLPGDARRPMRYVNLMGGQKPHLLVKTANNLGAETEVQYAPSTKFYLADKYAGRPWITKLPFPVHVVEKVTVTDTWRKTRFASTYSYHHGYFDGGEREFRGFGRVEQVDVESFGDFAAGNVASPYITDDKTLYQPPVKTITWYHTGAALDRQRILTQFQAEYVPNSLAALPGHAAFLTGFNEKLLPEPELDATLNDDEWREALRSCKGMTLRQEIYELDVDQLELGKQIPVRLFSTATHNCHIRCMQPQGHNQHAVFLATESEVLSYHYELDLRSVTIPAHSGPIKPLEPDPRIAHTLNLRFDEYGRALQTVAVVYPRQVPYVDSIPALEPQQLALIHTVQSQRKVAYTETHYTNPLPDDPNQHRLPAPCEVLTYELSGADSQHGFVPSSGLYFSLADLRAFTLSDSLPEQGSSPVTRLDYHKQPRDETAHKRIVEWVRMLYFKDNLSGAQPFGVYAWLGLPYETYKLALTRDLRDAVFGAKLTADMLAILDTPARSGYVPGTTLDLAFTDQYWMRSGIAGFAADAAQHFYLPESYTDPFGNLTTLKYDPRDLFVQSSRDALGNTSSILRFDYRVLAPLELVDPNGNHSEVYFDILGLVVAAAVKGKRINNNWQGDHLGDFTDAIANPSLATVLNYFDLPPFTAIQAQAQFSPLLGNATTRFLYHFGETIENGKLVWASRPAGACAIAREQHVGQLANGAPPSPLQIAFACSDGNGAVLMTRSQAEPEATGGNVRWIVGGKTVLNNKGKPVKQYEPYFSSTASCCAEGDEHEEVGVTPLMYYDAVGRLIRTELPDGTLSRVEFSPWHVKTFDQNDTVLESRWCRERLTATERGMPLYQPEDSPQTRVEAAAAEALAEHANVQEKRAATLSLVHADTPTVTILDSLGREVISIAHNKYTDSTGTSHNEKYLTFTKLDAEGKPLWIRDARGNLVMQYITPAKANNDPSDAMLAGAVPCYDIAGNLLFQHSMDAGDRWMLNDAAGKPMVAWDFNQTPDVAPTSSEQRLYFTEYDALHRPTQQWLSINNGPRQMIEFFEYTNTGYPTPRADLTDAQDHNLIGQLVKHYDPSGLVETTHRDFNGNVLEVKRRLNNQPTKSLIDWQTDPDDFLDEVFTQNTEYDALNRMTLLYSWHRLATPEKRVAVYEPRYNERGSPVSEDLIVRATKTASGHNPASGTITHAIREIRYNAKGQKEFLKLGNGTITEYSYDPNTFRLTKLETRRPVPAGDQCSSAFVDPAVIQDLRYIYDPVGNITQIVDAAQATEYFDNQRIDPINRYEYDSLYRLTQATGKESRTLTGAPTNSERDRLSFDCPAPDPAALRNYTQTYRYDSVGNIMQMGHVAVGGNGSWTRRYSYGPDSNRLLHTWEGDDNWNSSNATNKTTYNYDTHGNMLNLANVPDEYRMHWDHRDMIASINLGGGGTAYYQYDSGKQRTRKRIEKQNGLGGYWERIYLGGYELYRRYNAQGDVVEEIESLHVFEGEQRVLLVDDVITASGIAYPRPDGLSVKAQTLFRYQYSNQLGSACLELDDQAGIISYEEYHPYGTSAYRAVKSGVEAPPSRYRYTGMERDEESGLGYHRARYYMGWLGRWMSCDPAGFVDGLNIYGYVSENPIIGFDSTGCADDAKPNVYSDPTRKVVDDGPKMYANLPDPPALAHAKEQMAIASLEKPGWLDGNVVNAVGTLILYGVKQDLLAVKDWGAPEPVDSRRDLLKATSKSDDDFVKKDHTDALLAIVSNVLPFVPELVGAKALPVVLAESKIFASIVQDTSRVPAPFKSVDQLIAKLDAEGTQHAKNLAEGIRDGSVKVNLLGDELFEKAFNKYTKGNPAGTQGFTIDNNIYLRAERSSVASTAVHEGSHVSDFFTDLGGTGHEQEVRAFVHQVNFQKAIGEQPLFRSLSEIENYVRKIYKF